MAKEYLRKIVSEDVAKPNGNNVIVSELVYVVPSGKTLRLDTFVAGHEYTERQARVELVWRDGSDSILAAVYGPTKEVPVGKMSDFTGNGTSSLVIRLINGDNSGPLHMTGIWEGVLLDG